MGHRVYLSKNTENSSYGIFESNNNLPLFWVFLLDEKSIIKDKEYFIEIFNDEEKEDEYDYNSCIHISNETVKKNINRSLNYLRKFNSNLEERFKDFAKFIVDGSKESSLEFDIMQLAHFTDAEDFLNSIIATLGQIDKGEMIQEVSYYAEHEADFYELVGYECLEKDDCYFADFSKEYKNFIEQKSKLQKSYSKKEESTSGMRNMLSNILFPMITGIIFIITGFIMLIDKEGLFLPIFGIVFGSLAVFYGYAHINFKK